MLKDFLKDKNVLITGAGKNIGRSTAIEMAEAGAKVYFTDINSKPVEDLQAILGGKGKGFVADIKNTEDTDKIIKYLEVENITIDILVNNVGVGLAAKKLEDLDIKEWEKVYQTNIFGPMYLTKKIGSQMLENNVKGSIIFISSIHQWFIEQSAAYSSTKGAIGMIIKELAVDLAPKGIRVNGIAPGFVLANEKGEPYNKNYKYGILHNESILPEYIARAAIFLASDYFSKYTTGAVLKVDGGLSLYNHIIEQFGLTR